MPRPGQEPSIYICLNPVKTVDFMHPKLEERIVINSLIFVVVCKNILNGLNLGENYLWTKSALNKKKMTGYIKKPYTSILIRQMRCGKTRLVLELIEKEYNKYLDYIIIICVTLHENDTCHAKE